jgi:hypothetical protein
MRLLIALSIAQTALLGVLGVHALTMDARTREIAETAARLTAATDAMRASGAGAPTAYSADNFLTEDIRQIIREELAAAAPTGGGAPTPSASLNPGVVPVGAVPAETQAVHRALDDFIHRGRMTEGEMAAMQKQIGRLPPAERRRAMGKLIKAIEAGTLDAQL